MKRHFCTFLWWLALKSARLAIRLEPPSGVAWYCEYEPVLFNSRSRRKVKF
jgi:hypothetical protein